MRARHLVVVVLLSVVLVAMPAYLRAFTLGAASLAPSLNIGDTALVNEAAYSFRFPYTSLELFEMGHPERGDMVQARLPNGDNLGFKRVLGLPGETIELRENQVLINGRELPIRPLLREGFRWVSPANHIGSLVADEAGHWISFTPGSGPYRNSAPITLKPEQYFLIGDNRDESTDSRLWGPVTRERILGKVIGVLRSSPSP